MRNILIICLLSLLCSYGCTQEKKHKDRSEATDMFNRICKLTEEYTGKLSAVSDSSSWANACTEYEDKLDKISFSYPPDTDLLLTEGQNDTIHSLMLEYIKARDKKIQDLLHPEVELDSLVITDSAMMLERESGVNGEDASRNPGN